MPEAGRSGPKFSSPLRQRHQGEIAHRDRVPGLHRDTAYRPDLRGADFRFPFRGFQNRQHRLRPPSGLQRQSPFPELFRQRRGDPLPAPAGAAA